MTADEERAIRRAGFFTGICLGLLPNIGLAGFAYERATVTAEAAELSSKVNDLRVGICRAMSPEPKPDHLECKARYL